MMGITLFLFIAVDPFITPVPQESNTRRKMIGTGIYLPRPSSAAICPKATGC